MPDPNPRPARFPWPPTPRAAISGPPEGAGAAPVEGPWRTFEREILGLIDAPVGERLADAGWAADGPDEYCGRCGSSTGAHEATPAIALEDLALAEPPDATGGASCPACRGKRLAWHRAVRLGEYAGLLRDLVHELKFERRRGVGAELGRRLGLAVRHAMVSAGVDPASAIVVPVPMSFQRRWARGVDHSRLLARGVAAALGCPLVAALARRHRPTQWTVPESRRRANVRGAFRAFAARQPRLAGHQVVLIDDVRTTGATLTECCSTLVGRKAECRPSGLWVAVVGVTPAPGRRGGS
ncbi:MAG: ComF family protein [Phycisphaerae bacterium]|nr:ComF family protein [Phycisphaerae bacterium]